MIYLTPNEKRIKLDGLYLGFILGIAVAIIVVQIAH
jgi:hypothetical protein